MGIAFLAVLLAIMQAAPPMPRKAPDTTAQNAKQVKKNADEHEQPIAPAPSPLNSAEKPERDKNSSANKIPPNEQQAVTVRELPPVSVSRDWADWTIWVASALLTMVGILGIALAYFTLRAIKEQTAAELIAAKATQASVDLQKMALQQWVDVDFGEVRPIHIQPNATQAELPISIQLANQSKFPLTLHSLLLWIDGQHAMTVSFIRLQLPPDEPTEVNTTIRLEGPKLARYRAGTHVFQIGGLISFIDAFREPQIRKFGYICKCGPTAIGDFELSSFSPPNEAALRAQLREHAQKENREAN